MADPTQIQFGIHSYRSKSLQISSERCLNMYAEKQNARAKSPVTVRGAPGIVEFAQCGNGPIRALHEFDNTLYAVSGNFLYSISSAGEATQLGGQISGSGLVSIDDNSEEIVIVNGSQGYIYDTLSGFRLITDIDFHASNSVTQIDGFFLFARDDTGEIFISDQLDGESYSDFFATAESKSDDMIAVYNNLQLVYLFGKRTTEFWQNVGAANMPFRRMPAGVLNRGIIGPRAFASEDNTVFSLGDDKIAYKYVGSKVERISTTPIEEHWESMGDISDCEMLGYTFEGHKFIAYTFPTANETWVYDISTTLWHERSSRTPTGIDIGRWTGSCVAPAYGKTFVGDSQSGRIGYLDRSVFTEFGNQIIGEIGCPPLQGGGRYTTMPWLVLDIETGVGLTEGQGSDPQIMLSISDDGGRSYSGPEIWASMGKRGEHLTTVRFGPLGGFYERHMKLVMSDPVRRTIIAAYAPDMEVGL